MWSKARLLCVFLVFCILMSGCSSPPRPPMRLDNRIDFNEITKQLQKIKEQEFGTPIKASEAELKQAHLVLDTSYSISTFLDDAGLLTTYSDILSSLSDVFSGVSLTCYEVPGMNTGSSLLTLTPHDSGAARIEDWRSRGFYSQFMQGRNNGTNLYGMMNTVVEHMNSNGNAKGNLYVIISDITPQSVAGSNILSSEDQMNAIGKLLVENVILKEGTTFGIVGIQANKLGDLYGMPDRSGTKAGNPYQIPTTDIPSNEFGVYKTPIYLVLMGDERLVLKYADILKNSISNRIHPAANEIERYVVQKLEIRTSGILDDRVSETLSKMELPKVELSPDFAKYAVGRDEKTRTNVDYVYSSYTSLAYITQGSIPFFRLYDDIRYDGKNAGIKIASKAPYSIVLMPENKEAPLRAEFLDIENATASVAYYMGAPVDGSESDEQARIANTPITDLIERGQLELVTSSQEAHWQWNLNLKPQNFLPDVPVLFSTQTQMPLRDDKMQDLVLGAIADGADWIYNDDSEKSWSVSIPQYWDYRENGGMYTQVNRTPFLSSLFTTIRNEVARSISSELKEESEKYTRSALFGFVLRGAPVEYYPANVKNQDEDPDNRSIPVEHIDELKMLHGS